MKQFIVYIFIAIPFTLFAQLGGSSVYEFVNTPYSARENALGGNITSLKSGDVSLALKNPSLLDSSYAYKFGGTWGGIHIIQTNIGLGSFAYSHPINKRINFIGGIQFINYGRFLGFDENGNSTGTFFASDYQIVLGGSYKFFTNFNAGFNVKPILSYLESYSSFGLLGDAAVSYRSSNNLFNASVIVQNFGKQITGYTSDEKETIPYSINAGFTKQLKHAPFRFAITYRDLQKFDLRYSEKLSQQTNLLNADSTKKETIFTNIQANLMKHIQISTELLFIKNFNILVGYNYRKSEEMSFGASKKAVGMSFGFQTHFSFVDISYGWSKQHVAGSTNYFTMTTDIEKLYAKLLKSSLL